MKKLYKKMFLINTQLLLCVFFLHPFLLQTSLAAVSQKPTLAPSGPYLSYHGTLVNNQGTMMVGYAEIRVTFWKTKTVAPGELNNGVIDITNSGYLGFVETQRVSAKDDGSFDANIGSYVELPDFTGVDTPYMQLDFKPIGVAPEHWETIDSDGKIAGVQRITFDKNTVPDFPRKGTGFGTIGGALLDPNGTPLTGSYVARVSLWYSSDFDFKMDRLGDGSLSANATNFSGYSSLVPFETNNRGQFSLPLERLSVVAASLSGKKIFLQVELKKKEELETEFELIDPDGDNATNLDRYPIQDGKIVTGKALASFQSISPVGTEGAWLVQQIPNGTAQPDFELGASGTDPFAMIQIQANQGNDHKGILRYNGYTNKWEIGNDGVMFEEINAPQEYLRGTKRDNFAIALDNPNANQVTLEFGAGLAATIKYDKPSDSFQVSKTLDLMNHELKNVVIDRRPTPPLKPAPGQQYFNTVDSKMYFFDGTFWNAMGEANYSTVIGPSTTQIINNTGGGGTTLFQDIPFSAMTPRTKTWSLHPEYDGTVIISTPPSKGKLEEKNVAPSNNNAYVWSTTQTGSLQSLDITVQLTLPDDFVSFQATPIILQYRTEDTLVANTKLDVLVSDNANAAVTITGGTALVSGTADTWGTTNITFTGSPSFVAGGRIQITLRPSTKSGKRVEIGELLLKYNGR